jgi:hypothetical protein
MAKHTNQDGADTWPGTPYTPAAARAAAEETLGNERRVARLLRQEKRRRGVPDEGLVFLGMADIADYGVEEYRNEN